MSSTKPNIDVVKGNKISGKEANADKYIPFHEFLLFDPIYRQIPEKAKILYSYLRSKVSYFQDQTEKHQQGVEGTKSYMDEEGFIYMLADNTELIYILNASEPTVIKMKKILSEFGLLDEKPVKDKANRIYILKPKTLSNVWEHINQINQLRNERKEEEIKKQLKLKEKKRQKELEKQEKGKQDNPQNDGNLKKLSYENPQKNSNLNNLSHQENQGFSDYPQNDGNLKKLSHRNLNNLSKIELNVLNLNLKDLEEEDEYNARINKIIQSNLFFQELPRLLHLNNFKVSKEDYFEIVKRLLNFGVMEFTKYDIKSAVEKTIRMVAVGSCDQPVLYLPTVIRNEIKNSQLKNGYYERLETEHRRKQERAEQVRHLYYNWLEEDSTNIPSNPTNHEVDELEEERKRLNKEPVPFI